MIASRPVLSDSHMEAAIDQGSPCHLISSFGLVRLWLGCAKQSFKMKRGNVKRISERFRCAFFLAAMMSLFRSYPATGS